MRRRAGRRSRAAAARRSRRARRRPRRSRRRPRGAARRRAGRSRRVAGAEPPPRAAPSRRRRSDNYYQVKGTIFGALIEAIDLAQLAKLDGEFGARGNPRHRQRDHRDQEHRDVDRRAGRTARRHLQRRARLRSARAAAGARRHRRHHGQRRRHGLHRSRRQDPEDRHPLPRQPAAAQHLPAHRQPGRPARRRILADLRRAPRRRLPRQRHRAAAGDRRPRAHHPQVQEGQADARSAGQVRLDLAGRRRDPARSSAAAASTC